MTHRFFINRRTGMERRLGRDKRLNPRLDLSHHRRRKSDERRAINRSVRDDFYASNNFFNRKEFTRLTDKH